MRTFACVLLLAGCAMAGRLENTYLPPLGAAQSGGINLATPFVNRNSAALQAPQNTYLPPGQGGLRGSSFSSSSSSSSSSQNIAQAGFLRAGQQQQQVNSYSGGSLQQATPRPALIIKQVNENPGDGTYTFSYETENGIQAQEQGQIRADGAEGLAAVQGAYAFTAPDNVRYTVTYTADENGFLAQGEHLPTPPPVPAEILRALEQNAADEARGIVDDGQYRSEYQGQQQQQQGGFLRGGSSAGYSSYSGGSSSSSSKAGYQY